MNRCIIPFRLKVMSLLKIAVFGLWFLLDLPLALCARFEVFLVVRLLSNFVYSLFKIFYRSIFREIFIFKFTFIGNICLDLEKFWLWEQLSVHDLKNFYCPIAFIFHIWVIQKILQGFFSIIFFFAIVIYIIVELILPLFYRTDTKQLRRFKAAHARPLGPWRTSFLERRRKYRK